MKSVILAAILGVGIITSGVSLAGQSQQQIDQTRHAMEAKQKAAQELARQQTQDSPSVAGSKGEAGTIGPSSTNPSDRSQECAFRNQRSGTCVKFK